jgi:hypothetical protein
MEDVILIKGDPSDPDDQDITIHLAKSRFGKVGGMPQCVGCRHYEFIWNFCRKILIKKNGNKRLARCQDVAEICGLANF